MKKELSFSKNLVKAKKTLRAVNHKLRQQILQLLHENGKLTVTKVYCELRLEQSVASQHLRILRDAGLVNAKRDGKFIQYSVNYERLELLEYYSLGIVSKAAIVPEREPEEAMAG